MDLFPCLKHNDLKTLRNKCSCPFLCFHCSSSLIIDITFMFYVNHTALTIAIPYHSIGFLLREEWLHQDEKLSMSPHPAGQLQINHIVHYKNSISLLFQMTVIIGSHGKISPDEVPEGEH